MKSKKPKPKNQWSRWLGLFLRAPEELGDKLVTGIYRNDEKAVLEAIRKGADVNAGDEDGMTPIMTAILADDHNPRIVQHLIASGADVNYAEPRQQWMPLHFAAREGRVEAVELLLASGAAVDATDVFGNTPLWRAVMEFRHHSGDVIRILLRHGADKLLANKSGISPLKLAETLADNAVVLDLLAGG